MVGLVAAVIVLGGPSITNSAATVTRQAPEAVRSMETLPLVGRLLERNGAPDKVEKFLGSLPDRLRESDSVERIARAAGDGVAGAFWTISFMLAILWDGPRLVRAVRSRVPLTKRRRVVRFGRAAYTALSNVVAAAAFVAALNGTVVMLLAIALGIPLAPILGLWAATWNFIPQIGGFVGAMPLVALGFGQGPWQGLIALVVFVTYQTFENHVIQPLIGSRVVHVPPLVLLIGALVRWGSRRICRGADGRPDSRRRQGCPQRVAPGSMNTGSRTGSTTSNRLRSHCRTASDDVSLE